MNDKVIYSNHSENKSNEYSSAMLSSNVERNDTNSNYPNATDDVYYCAPSKSGTKWNITNIKSIDKIQLFAINLF